MRVWTALATIAVALVAAAPAAAAQPPIALGPGGGLTAPIVEANGTAHFLITTAGGYTYCRLPRRARACDVRTFLALNGGEFPRLRRRSDGALFVIAATNEKYAEGVYGKTYLFSSGDRGVTWSGATLIAGGQYDLSSVELMPSGQSVLTLRVQASALSLQHAPFSGGETRTLNLLFGDDSPQWTDMDALPDGRIMLLIGSGDEVRWRVFGSGDPYDINAWATTGSLPGVSDAQTVTGPRGTYLMQRRSLADQRTGAQLAPLAFRSLDTRRLRWRPALKAAAGDRSIFGGSTAIQDGRGRLHLIAETGGAGLTNCVLYTRTGPRRNSWFGRTTVLFRTSDDAREPLAVRVGAAPDGRGWALWSDQGGQIWALPLRQARGSYRPKRLQNDRPACVGRRYS